MTTVSITTAVPRPASVADAALAGSARFWFVTALIGQWAFLYYIAAFYGPSTLQGHFQAWTKNTMLNMSYVAADSAGNLFFAAHALLAGVIAFGGALQLVPQIRDRAPAVHRWNGRLFMLTALGVSLAGLYLVWIRNDRPSGMLGGVSLSLNAALIIAFVVLAWRAARAGDFATHRRWALRLYLVANAQWFTRVGVFAVLIIHRAWVDAFFPIWGFGCYLVPLAVLELYLRTKDGAGPRGRLAMAGGLAVLTVLMGVGIFGIAMFGWLPLLAKA